MACEQLTRLGDVIELEDVKREPISSRDRKDRKGSYPYYGAQGIVDYLDDYTYEGDYLLVAEDGENLRSRKNPIANAASGKFRVNNHAHVIAESEKCNLVFLRHLLNMTDISAYVTGSTQPKLSQSNLCAMKLPLPSMAEQNAIANVLSLFDRKIELNNQLNDYLADLCETIAGKYCNDRNSCLRDICYQVTDHVDYGNANQETYVSTESLMQNKGGRQLASSLPTTGKITRYRIGDTLISNIRPYFKKIWYAPFEGTCSGDVIVFRANDPSNAPYLHACLRQDSFFDYVMQGAKGTKMPRGDKKQMMEFKVASSCSTKDLILLDSAIKQRSDNDSETVKLQALRDTLLPKLMSGEIDVSKVDLTQLTNNHLSGCGSFCSVCCPSGLASEFHEWFREHFFFGYGHLCKADLG